MAVLAPLGAASLQATVTDNSAAVTTVAAIRDVPLRLSRCMLVGSPRRCSPRKGDALCKEFRLFLAARRHRIGQSLSAGQLLSTHARVSEPSAALTCQSL